MITTYRKPILITFGLLSLVSLFFLTKLKFTFDFEQFFPQGDEDLEFFRNFTEEFEADDNFLLIAVEHQPSVFDSVFVNQFHQYNLAIKRLPFVNNVQSITTLRYPLKTPFGMSSIPVIHLNQPSRLEADSMRVMNDPRFKYNMINAKGDATVAVVKTKNRLSVYESQELIDSIHQVSQRWGIKDYHLLGRAYFQESIIRQQQWEVAISSICSIVLVSLILFFIFRKVTGVIIALTSIAISLLIFMGFMGAMGRPLSVMSALYPVLMLIVGTSDVVHIMSKYIDELAKGHKKEDAISITIKQIGLATLLTSVTTAIGFATLLTSRLEPIRDFGINSAIGVLIAFITTLCITTALLSFFNRDQIMGTKDVGGQSIWDRFMERSYKLTLSHSGWIKTIFGIAIALCIYGVSMVTTNYRISGNLPTGEKITEDFHFFEKEFSGFRPLEFAIMAQGDFKADSYEVVSEINKLENHLIETKNINSVVSQATLYKSVSQMNAGNQRKAYVFPKTKEEYLSAKKIIDQLNREEATVLINKTNDKTRISTKVADIGADNIRDLGHQIDQWIATNIDSNVIRVKQTGTGLIIDKNSEYVRESLLYGLGLALIIISVVMGLMLMSLRMLILAFVPNLVPLLFAGALLGYFDVELEAGISIVFAVIFGIAVDDTIHFLSKFKLCRVSGMSIEKSIEITFKETGKAILFTTIILFFGFLIMLFSANPPTRTIGGLISVTLFAALLCDVYLLPILMRRFLKE